MIERGQWIVDVRNRVTGKVETRTLHSSRKEAMFDAQEAADYTDHTRNEVVVYPDFIRVA